LVRGFKAKKAYNQASVLTVFPFRFRVVAPHVYVRAYFNHSTVFQHWHGQCVRQVKNRSLLFSWFLLPGYNQSQNVKKVSAVFMCKWISAYQMFLTPPWWLLQYGNTPWTNL